MHPHFPQSTKILSTELSNFIQNKLYKMKTALITGASSGIGKAFTELLASKNVNLVITARRTSELNEIKANLENKHNISVTCFPMDLAIPNAAVDLYQQIKEAKITIDYLINNAGFGGHGEFYKRDWKEEANMIQLNILTLTQLCHLFLPDFITQNSGRILNVASSAALVPGGPLQSVYFATKAYVLSFSQGLAGELTDKNITVTALCPGATETEFEKNADLEGTQLFSGKTFSAEEVAKDGYKAMINGDLKKITALSFTQKAGMKAASIVPTELALKTIKDMQQKKS